jgi:hypothetical protein
MSIIPENITTVRVDQLPNEPATLSSLLAHQVGTELKQTSVSDFISLVANAIESGSGVGFLPVTVSDGQTLPPIPENPSFILVGAGTYGNLDGFPDLVCTENLNALITVGTHWEISVEIPINPLTGSVQSVTGSAVDNTDPLNPVINLTGGSTSTPTLQEVTDAGNEIETDINVKSIFFKIGDLDEDNTGTGILIDNDESSINFFRNLENFMTFNRDGIAGINSLGGVWAFKFSEIEGSLGLKFPNKTNGDYTIATIDDVISSNTTATNGTKYLAVANLTMTDITPPSEGAFYEVTVINGTATIGGVGYTVGQKVFRHFHSGSWRTFVYPSLLQLDNFLRDETLLKGYICLTPAGISAPNNFKDVTYSSSATTGYILQNAYAKSGAIAMVGFQSTAVAGTVGFKRRNDSYIFSNTNANIWQKIEFDSNVSGARFHHLLSNNFQFIAPTNVEPNTIINCVGFCKLSTSGNLHVVHNDNTGTATTIDLGASFPANNSGGNKRYLLGIQIKASSYVLTVIEINTTTNALTTNIYTTEVSSDIPSRTLNGLQISTMITNNATASNATYLDGGFSATNII